MSRLGRADPVQCFDAEPSAPAAVPIRGQWVGRIGPWSPEDWPGTEVGWGLLRVHWGKGYGAEAATAAIDWAFDALGWSEVIHTIASENANSKALPTRIGSRYLRLGRLPAPWDIEMEIWGQSKDEWRARRAIAKA